MTTAYYADIDLDSLATFYSGRLLNDPVVRRRMVDPLRGFVAVQDVDVTLANADLALVAPFVADLRGHVLVLRRYDLLSGTTITEWTGTVDAASLADGELRLRGTNADMAIFDTLIPKGTVTTADFPNAIDVGRTPPVVFGNVPKVRCLLVNENVAGNTYDYLVARGTVTVSAAWRDGPGDRSLYPITGGEYTVSTLLYPGYTVMRFTTQQINFQNGRHTLYADVTGLAAERNFAQAVETLLGDATYGLGQTSIDAASFAAAQGQLDAIGGLYCDLALTEPQPAHEVLRKLLMVRGMRLGTDATGQWTITVDGQQIVVQMALGDGAVDGERNIASAGERSMASRADRPKSYALRYRLDLLESDAWLFTQSRAIAASGREVTEDHPAIRDHTTADKVCDYVAKRLDLDQHRTRLSATQEARQITEGMLVSLTYAPLGHAASLMEVREVGKGRAEIDMVLAPWAASIYTYAPGTIPADEITGTFTDYSRTDPAVVSALSISSSGTELSAVAGGDGRVTSFVVLQFTTATTNCSGARVDVRKNGETTWGTGWGLTNQTGAAVQVRVGGLTPGISYDYRVLATNMWARVSADTTLTAQVAPGDTTAPGVPTGLAAGDKKLTSITFTWTAPTALDVKGYDWDVRTASGGAGSLVTSGSVEGTTLTLTVTVIGYAATRWFRVRAVDRTGNASAYASAVSFSFTQAAAGDYGPGSVDNPAIGDGAVTTTKRQDVNNTTWAPGSMTALLALDTTHTHNLGIVPIVNVTSANGKVIGFVNLRTVNVFRPSLYNTDPGANQDPGTVQIDYW